jgi:hypothetical protein
MSYKYFVTLLSFLYRLSLSLSNFYHFVKSDNVNHYSVIDRQSHELTLLGRLTVRSNLMRYEASNTEVSNSDKHDNCELRSYI